MPIGDGRADIVRRVIGLEGTVAMRHEWVVRLGYGKIRPWVRRQDMHGTEVITAVAGPDRLILRGHRLPRRRGRSARRRVRRARGRGDDVLDHLGALAPPAPRAAGVRVPHRADHRDRPRPGPRSAPTRAPTATTCVRSLVTLRLLTHGGTGGIVAAVTTSLPEDLGGERNWDYRFCWLRDASLTLEALLESGYDEEALLWRSWLLRAAAGDPQDLQIMYAVDGGRDLAERTLDHLPGLRRLHAGADRQRRGAPAPDRRARRGDDRPGDGPRRRRARTTRTPGRCSGSWSRSWPGTGTSRTTGCGRSAVRSGSSRTPG